MRALRHLPMSVLVLVLVTATLSWVAAPEPPTSPAPAAAGISTYPPGVTGGTFDQDRRLYNPDLDSCEEERPANQFVTYPSYAQTAAQICAMWGLQNAAAAAYNAMHGYGEGDEVLVSSLYAQAGLVQTFLQQIAYAVGKNVSGVTPAQRAAYDWFRAIQQHFQRTAAAEALREYHKWETQQCGYRPPDTTVFAYNPSSQPVCNPDDNPGLIGLFTSVAPPTYANFVQYGRYDAERILGLAHQAAERVDRTLIDNGIVAGSGAVAAVLAGGAPHVAATFEATAGALGSFLRVVQPHNRAVYNSLRQAGQVVSKAVQGAVKAGRVVLGSQRILNQMRAAADLVKTGARSLSGPMTIATIAITIAVTRGISVFTAAAIPKQLAGDAAAAEPTNPDRYVLDLLTADEGVDAPIVYANYRAQLQFPEHTVGVQATPAACPTCVVYDELPLSDANPPARIRMTALHPDGRPSGWSRLAPVATRINTWGMGAANGALGVPTVSVGIAGGKVWTKQDPSSAPSDETEAGLTGWLPSGELRYFDPSGQPMIAYLNGEQFLTQTSPGSVSAGGYDAGDNCATPGQCTASSSIVVMGSGGTPELRNEITNGTFFGMECTANTPGTHDCLTDTLSPNGRLVPANGTRIRTSDGEVLEQKGTSQLYRLTIVPNRGTTPTVWVTNDYNSFANNKTNGLPPGGGLVAGETVTFGAPEISDAGYDTTYTWHVQTVCPADPDHPAQTIQGVLVCSGDPSYGERRLPANQQDLTSCEVTGGGVCRPDSVFGVTWTPDPAFHGGPVATMTGRSVEWTWPAAGTYHLRLVTRDQYGVTRSSDQDLVVAAATAPRSVLSYAAAADPQPRSLGPSVIGPVANGTALTVTGCVLSPTTIGTTSYATPAITIDWGDGVVDTDVAVVRGAGGGCTTPWRWEATHTFTVDTHGRPLVQVPITVTTRDVTFPATAPEDLPLGTRASSAVTVYANVHAAELPPAFLSGASAMYDFVAGEFAAVGGSVTSVPDATISQAPASGVVSGGVSCAPGLPPGTGFATLGDNRFQISGIPTAGTGGCYAVTLTAQNPHGSVEQHAVVAVAQAPEITSASSIAWDPATGGHSHTVTTSGFPAPRLRVTGVDCTTGCGTALPDSVALHDNGDGTATLSTTALSAHDTGVYEVTIEAASSSGSATQVLTLTVDGPPVFTSPARTGFQTGQPGTFPIEVSSVAPVTLTCHLDGSDDRCRTGDGTRPLIAANFGEGTGLSLVNGTITGIPAVAGAHRVTLTATSTAGSTTQELTILVSASGGATITMVDTGSDDNLVRYVAGPIPSGEAPFTLGQPGFVTLCSNVPGDVLRTETVVDGRVVDTPLPAGLSIEKVANMRCGVGDQQLELRGTPTAPAPGTNGATAYRLVDNASGLALLTVRLLSDAGPVFSSPDTAQFRAGEPGSFAVSLGTARYANGSYELGCLTGAAGLPAGLSFNGGADGTATISGTPAFGGTSLATITGTDCHGQTTTQELTIEVAEAPVVTSENGAGFRVGVGGTFTITTNVTAHPRPELRVTGLPDGVGFTDEGDGTGTLTVAPEMPATEAPVTLRVTATSPSGTDTQQLRLAVGTAPTMVSPTGRATVALPRDLTASYTVRSSAVPVADLTASTLPAGLVFTDNGNGTGTLSGTPTSVGETDVTVSARNGVGEAATSTLHVVVTDPASLAGTTSGAPCAATSGVEDHVFVAATEGSWVLCGGGTPAPAVTLQSVECDGEVTNLPPGLTFTDRGDGSAVIEGAAAIGSGAACPDGYTAAVAFANAGGTVVEDLSLSVREVIELASPTTTAPFVAGAPNTAAIGAAGAPVPSFAVEATSPLPAWLELVDQGTGTAIVSGTPPAGAAGSSVSFTLRITNGQADPLSVEITVPVSDIGLGAAAPPAARLGTAYSHQLEVPDGVTVGLAEGGALPQGLTLSPAGLLAGTPTELGRFPVPLALTRGGTTVTTGAIELHVVAGKGALTISQFRTLDPSDWFVQVVNTTDGPIDLAGWHVGLQPPGEHESIEVPLGTGSLDPGDTAVVTTPLSSLGSQLEVTGTNGGEVVLESGFRVVAPSGVVTDAAGVAGALPDLVEGDGVAYPTRLTKAHLRYAFVRTGFDVGAPEDSDDNASDFTFAKVVGVEDPPPPPPAQGAAEVAVGFDVAAPVFGQPVTASASVTVPGGSSAGTVQFGVDGVDLGAPVAVRGGIARSGPLGVRTVGAHTVTAEFRPAGSAAVVGRGTLIVGRAATTTQVGVGSNAFTATVMPVAPGAGQPTGPVTFLIDGVEVGSAPLEDGTATLEHAAPAGPSPTIAATYSGDDSFTGSSASTALRNPTITARISSAEPRSASGWFRTPVTVTFTCTPGDAPLAGPCPAPVTLRQEGAGQSITRTVVATDGGAATVAVSPINIDRTGPRVRVRGVRGATSGRPPRGVCAAQDALSGVASCTITRSIHPRRVVYVAVATDEAGNTATDRVVVRRRR